MKLQLIEKEFKEKISNQISLYEEGRNRYIVFSPFMFDDGDHLSIVLKQEGEKWIFSDEGTTYMRLTYDIDEKDLFKGNRLKIINNSLSMFDVKDREGELIITIEDNKYSNALFSFIQAILRISDVSFLNREWVKSTFMEDFKEFMIETVTEERCSFDWYDREHDSKGLYIVDCRINSRPKPIFVFALLNDDKTQKATITLLNFEKWGMKFDSIGIFENQEEINSRILVRFTDVLNKPFSSLDANNRERARKYILTLP